MSSSTIAEIRNRHGERLDFTLQEGKPGCRDLVVIAHGVTSNKDRPWLTAIADALAADDIAALRFSYAGNGASDGRFQDATPTKEVDDLGSVIDAVVNAGYQRIAYVGHSMGGAIGVMRAAIDPRINVLVSLAGMVHVHAFMQQQFGALVPGKDCMIGKPECIWSATLAQDAARVGSLVDTAARIQVPWLLVHGDADEQVPLGDSRDAVNAAQKHPELVVLTGADHRFTDAIPHLIAIVVPWLRRRLG